VDTFTNAITSAVIFDLRLFRAGTVPHIASTTFSYFKISCPPLNSLPKTGISENILLMVGVVFVLLGIVGYIINSKMKEANKLLAIFLQDEFENKVETSMTENPLD